MSRYRIFSLLALVAALASPSLALAAAPASDVSAGDTAWVLASSALVLLMTPGLALFYGGMVRRKNVVTTLFQCFAVIGAVSIQWVLFGYSLAFGPDVGGVIGNLSWLGFRDVGLLPNPDYAATIPHQAFAVFQMMFAVITPALILGAMAERANSRAILSSSSFGPPLFTTRLRTGYGV